MKKKTKYLLFCSNCGHPQIIPPFIIQNYFINGVGVYCENCENQTPIPEYLVKLKKELTD